MVLAVLVVPIALLTAMFGMGVVERWVDRDAALSPSSDRPTHP